MNVSQKIALFLELAFDTRNLDFGIRNLILSDAARATGLTLWHSGHGKHSDIVHFEIAGRGRTLACFI